MYPLLKIIAQYASNWSRAFLSREASTSVAALHQAYILQSQSSGLSYNDYVLKVAYTAEFDEEMTGESIKQNRKLWTDAMDELERIKQNADVNSLKRSVPTEERGENALSIVGDLLDAISEELNASESPNSNPLPAPNADPSTNLLVTSEIVVEEKKNLKVVWIASGVIVFLTLLGIVVKLLISRN